MTAHIELGSHEKSPHAAIHRIAITWDLGAPPEIHRSDLGVSSCLRAGAVFTRSRAWVYREAHRSSFPFSSTTRRCAEFRGRRMVGPRSRSWCLILELAADEPDPVAVRASHFGCRPNHRAFARSDRLANGYSASERSWSSRFRRHNRKTASRL